MSQQTADKQFDVVESWIDSVSYSHSNSQGTAKEYKNVFNKFCKFIGKNPQQILDECNAQDERVFKRQYAALVKAWISALGREGCTNGTICTRVGIVKSFFKYNDLPLGFVPVAVGGVVYHNRDVEKEEIEMIINASPPRERAFYAVMAQSGLRPNTIVQLRLKHLEPDFSVGRIPYKIEVPKEITKGKYSSYYSFIGPEAIKHLRNYLNVRGTLTPESLLFTEYGSNDKPASTFSLSKCYAKTIRKLKAKGVLKFEQKAYNKPAELRLYSLRKYFRKMAGAMGFEYVQFMMGHIVKAGCDENYRPRDPEFYRKLYEEKAMPFLRISAATPTETESVIEDQRQKIANLENQNTMLKKRIEEDGKAFSARIEAIERELREKGTEAFLLSKVDEHMDAKLKPLVDRIAPVIAKLDNAMSKERGSRPKATDSSKCSRN
jgi:integrase